MQQTDKVSFFHKWWVSSRPFSFPASTMPVIFGTVLAVFIGEFEFNLLNFILAFLGMLILHSGSNILNDIVDYQKGIDQMLTPVSGGVIRKIITIKEAKKAVIILFGIGILIGLYLTIRTTSMLLVIGGIGVLIGLLYTANTKFALKYRALGDFAVFLNFGIFGALGAWFVQANSLSWIPVIWVIPMAILVIGILHANNWRDIKSDTEGNIYTIASLLGDKKSLWYYGFLIFGPYIFILLLIIIPNLFAIELLAMPYVFLITLLTLPMALQLWKKASSRHTANDPMVFIALDGATSKLNLSFGLLCIIAVILFAIIG